MVNSTRSRWKLSFYQIRQQQETKSHDAGDFINWFGVSPQEQNRQHQPSPLFF